MSRDIILPKESAQQALNEMIPKKDRMKIRSVFGQAYHLAYNTTHGDQSMAKWLTEGRSDFALASHIKQIAVENGKMK